MLNSKRSILSILFITLRVLLTSEEVYEDKWLSTGYESANLIETRELYGEGEVSAMNTMGLNLTAYSFSEDDDVGSFVSDSMLFTVDGFPGYYESQDVHYHLGIAFGPAYRKKMFNDLLFFKGGLGLSVFMYGGGNRYYNSTFFNFGLAGEVGFKYDINETYYLDIGTKLGYDMLNMSILGAEGEEEFSYTTDYQMIRFAPYIGFGLNFYNRNGKLELR